MVILYAALGRCCWLLLLARSPLPRRQQPGREASVQDRRTGLSGLERSRAVVFKLSALFALDSFGGGFVDPELRGVLVLPAVRRRPGRRWARSSSAANIFAGISALLASRLAARFGLINTMVVTHLPSNVLLILVPLMPTSAAGGAGAAVGSASARWTCRRGSPT